MFHAKKELILMQHFKLYGNYFRVPCHIFSGGSCQSRSRYVRFQGQKTGFGTSALAKAVNDLVNQQFIMVRLLLAGSHI